VVFLHEDRVIVLTLILMPTGFHFHACGAQPVCFNHVMTQGKAHFGCQRMHDVFNAFCTPFTTPQRSQINMADVWVG
jgi:hypothetical protein